MLKAKLVVVGGDTETTEVELSLPTIIGRGREANLTVPHALVSRRHAEIVAKDGRLLVRDLGSLNGTFVNNKRIDSEQPLEPNQLLTLGNVTFRAIYEINENDETESISSRDTESVLFDDENLKASHPGDLVETIPVDEFDAASKDDVTKSGAPSATEPSATEPSPPKPTSISLKFSADATFVSSELIDVGGSSRGTLEAAAPVEDFNLKLGLQDKSELDAVEVEAIEIVSDEFPNRPR